MRVAYLWPSGDLYSNRYVSAFHALDPAAAIIKPGNAGDMFVTEASLALTRPAEVEFFDPRTVSPQTLERINSAFDLVFVRGANTLADQVYAGILAEFIEKLLLRVVVMGIGVQAPSLDRMPASPEVHRLARLLGERSTVVGVRGQVTADFLAQQGLRNIQIVGCPSLLRHNASNLRIRKPAWSDLHSFGFSLTRYHGAGYQRDKFTYLDVQSRIIKELHRAGRVGLITQVEREEKAFAYRDAEEMQRATTLLRDSKWFDAEMENIYRTRSVFFGARPSDYDMHVRNFDVVFGTRMHSNAMAIACGTPAVTLSFDLRVQEIYEFWRLPVFTVEAARTMSARELYERADFAAFNGHSRFIYSNFRDYLEANGVAHRMTDDDPVGFDP
jgi:hypothetical protein